MLGAQTGVIGLIERVAEPTASLLKIASGAILDRIGRRKWLSVGGDALSTASKPLLLAAGSWCWVFWSRFGDRTGKGLRTAASDALVADSIDVAQRGLAFGIPRAGDTGGSSTSHSLRLDGKLPEISLGCPEKSRGIRSDFVTIMTVGEGEPAENQGSKGADAPEIGYLLIPSCESRASFGSRRKSRALRRH